MRKVAHKVALISLSVGILLLARGLWIPVKAEIAQVLLAKAWATTLATGDYQKPWSWADVKAIGKLNVKGQDIEQIILSGMNGQSMAFGPAHNTETAMPGDNGMVMLGGHRDTHFSFLDRLSVGDTISIEGLSIEGIREVKSYSVSETFIIDVRRDTLHDTGLNVLMLVTCYPFDSKMPDTPFRYVVLSNSYELTID